ncbi:Hamartin [Aphelenchoides fujianensis]|nr:Hamartin [Aphelenchoides fujianensis]
MPLLNKRKATVKAETIIKQIRLCEALDAKISEEAKSQLQAWIQEGIGITQLVTYYASYQSVRALEILCNVNEPHDKALLDEMAECLQRNPQGTMVLIGRVVQKAPGWLCKLPSHDIFGRLLDLIRTSKNLEVVNSALLLIAALLPHCPTLSDLTLRDLFRAFLDGCKTLHQKRKSSMESWKQLQNDQEASNKPFTLTNIIVLMQLEALQHSLGVFFNVIYGIYPCNIIILLQKYAQTGGHSDFFASILEPLLLSVRFHPNLLLENREREISVERWNEHGPNEFFAVCQKVATCSDAAGVCSPAADFDRRLNERMDAPSIKNHPPPTNCIHAINSKQFGMFTRGLKGFGFDPYFNEFGLDTPPNELNHEDFPNDEDLFAELRLEGFLNDSLVNTNSSNSLQFAPQSPSLLLDGRLNNKRGEFGAAELLRLPTGGDRVHSRTSTGEIRESWAKRRRNSARLPPSVLSVLKDYARSRSKDEEELTREQMEALRKEYMIEGENYHYRLKLLGLADLLPGKIYDNLSEITQGLSAESARDLLEARLRLVNQHLMFERSCRLIHAQRNQKLFERLRKQSTMSSENDRLRAENRQLRGDLSQSADLLANLKSENARLRTAITDREKFFLLQLEAADSTIESARIEMENLRHNSAALEHNFNVQRKRLESVLAANEREAMSRQFAEFQASEFQRLKDTIADLHHENERLRDRCQALLIEQDAMMTSGGHGPEREFVPTEDRIQILRNQLQRARDELAKNRDKCALAEANCATEVRRRVELQLALDRTAKMHSSQVEAAEHKYEALLMVCDKQETHIAYLNGLLQTSKAKSIGRSKNPSFTGIFDMEELNSELVNKHLNDLFGGTPNEDLQLADRNDGITFKRPMDSLYAPSSLDAQSRTEIKKDARHRRPSLTTEHETLSTIMNETNKQQEKEEEQKAESPRSASTAPSFPRHTPDFQFPL